jgi:hypothetical protein
MTNDPPMDHGPGGKHEFTLDGEHMTREEYVRRTGSTAPVWPVRVLKLASNCQHDPNAWCLDCVIALLEQQREACAMVIDPSDTLLDPRFNRDRVLAAAVRRTPLVSG